ncbi:MAG: hypothetical protein GY807_24785 [Gammaproteobacteria bacterium]|nr:hypothetical protein [Gammaproteobacteria bacterium]
MPTKPCRPRSHRLESIDTTHRGPLLPEAKAHRQRAFQANVTRIRTALGREVTEEKQGDKPCRPEHYSPVDLKEHPLIITDHTAKVGKWLSMIVHEATGTNHIEDGYRAHSFRCEYNILAREYGTTSNGTRMMIFCAALTRTREPDSTDTQRVRRDRAGLYCWWRQYWLPIHYKYHLRYIRKIQEQIDEVTK